MQVPIAPPADDDLMEALGYFSEDVAVLAQDPRSPCEADATDEAMDSMLLSLEIQELLSTDDKVKVEPASLEEPKKIDRRLRPYSTCKRRNRRRPKHELEYLRAKVVELQEDLETLGKAEVGSPNAVGQETALATLDLNTGVSSWKEIAERQKLGVESSVAENRRLRNRLLGQLQVARVLEAAIAQHQKETGESTIGGVGRSMNGTDREIFAQLNSCVDKQFAEVNTELTTSGLANVLHQLSGGFEFKREANGITFRHEETRLLPFSMQAFHHAIWNCLHNGSIVKQTHAQIITQNHSNLVVRETLQLPKTHRINVTKRSVFRRHVEKDRVVFVWTSYVEIDGSVCVRLRERGWSTCSTFEFHRGVSAGDNSSSNCIQGCMTRMAIQLTPEVSEFQSEKEAQRHIGDVTDLIVGTYHQNFGLIHEVVERILVTTKRLGATEADSDNCGKVVVIEGLFLNF
ncbi:hypothetical protein L914_08438 [Phytophthora nicotianae]|uniref:M96 mating-specific protein family n=2 Tax=Phytophthora nicotianae TaxID=4792 RepID=V9F8A0_PHYNI|nr:hypothetical protein F443_08724 [Phytophthora nicotianae P1569]ETM46718.1 hypothetical protein L914_08438 [Phytophthora nicotianae]